MRASTLPATNRRALLVGIDRYANLPYPLAGCVNDAQVLTRLLEDSYGFGPDATTTLLNEQATRERILAELDALVDATEQDDVVVIAYSGHGSQMTDRDGDDPDALDETIVPYDSGRAPHENRDITDDEIYERLLELAERTRYITLLFDCCHSGSVSRDGFGDRARWIPPDRRPASELPPAPARPRERDAGGMRDLGPSGWLPLSERYVLIAGCRDDESSYEHTIVQEGGEVVVHGALTYFLSQQLVDARPGTTYRDVFERASPLVTAAYPRQHPQIEGAFDRELFGVRDIVPMRYATVGPRPGSTVTIGAGLVHGARVGSQWVIYPPGTAEVDPGTTRLGIVELTTVRATESEGEPIEEQAAGAIAEGCRATEHARAFGDFRLRVQVSADDDEAAAPLLAGIESSGILASATADAPADARVYLLSPREEAGSDDPVPQVPEVSEVAWAVVGRDGKLMMPLQPTRRPSSASTVVANLETAARYQQALALSNPDPGDLEGKVVLVLKRRDQDGAWVEAEADPVAGHVTFTDGDRVAIEIRNDHTIPLCMSVLDFGLAGAVDQLFPIAGASEPLAAGRSISFGERKGEETELRFPDGAADDPDPGDAGRPGGLETFKLIAASSPIDLRLLLQPGYRGTGKNLEPSSARELFALALTGRGTRDIVRPTAPSDDDAWLTLERPFVLRRGD
jgi:hypothetical protein